MNKIILLALINIFLFGCTKKEETLKTTESSIDLTLELTNVSKYFFAGDVLSTDVLYSPQGISMGEVLLDEKIVKTIQLKNSPLYEDFATDIRIEEKEPKIFGIEKNDCSILKTGASCLLKINAFYSDNLFTSTKTARLVFGKKDGVDLYIEIYAQIRNVSISSSQFESNYSISMNNSFSSNYSQFSFQQRTISIKNNSTTKYLRNDYLIPRLVGVSPNDFYISSNDCMYPLSPNDSCDIRVIYKKWKTQNQVSDTEIKFPNILQNYSLKYAQLVTYDPVYSDWGVCSASTVCSGVGTQSRTISDCIKNSLYSVSVSNCSENGVLVQSCNSPAGNQTIPIIGGTKEQSCLSGSTIWQDQSVLCNNDFHESSMSCSPDIFIPTFSDYSPSTNPLTDPCTGTVNGTRSITSCMRQHNSEVVANDKCIDPSPSIIYSSPIGNRSENIPNGIQSQTCLAGSTTWIVTSVSCLSGYYQNGNMCDPIIYVPTYSAYSVSPVESTVCTGSDIVSRSVLSCVMQHNNQIVSNSLCVDPNPTKTVYSPQGSQLITLYDPITSNAMGIQSQSCLQGETNWVSVSTNCYQYYSVNGSTCVANNLSSPTINNLGPVIYSQTSSYIFNVSSDLNATNLDIYSDPTCSSIIGTGIYTGLNWTTSASFVANSLTGVYAKTSNSYTLKESSCNYLFDYMYDSISPIGSFSINNGDLRTTSNEISINFSSASDNSGIIQNIKIYEQAACAGVEQNLAFQNNIQYSPSVQGTNLTISVKLVDAAGNESGCIQDSIFFGLEVLDLYSNSQYWNSYVDLAGNACSGSGNCIHSGEKKVIELDQTNCANLAMTDDIGIFDWKCEADPNNLGKVRFVSYGISKDKGISSLIDDTQLTPSWKTNKVLLFQNQSLVNTSESLVWYSNPLSYVTGACYNSSNINQPSLTTYIDCTSVIGNYWNIGSSPTVSTTLTGTTNTIFIIRKTNRSLIDFENFFSNGLILGQNSISLVVMPEVYLFSKTTSTNLIESTGRNYLYIEGAFFGSNLNLVEIGSFASNSGLLMTNSNYGIINNGIAKNFSNGIRFSNSNYFSIQSFSSLLNTNHGIYLTTSSNNKFYKNIFSSNYNSGIYLETNSNSNSLFENTISNNLGVSYAGIYMAGSQLNKLEKNSISNNSGNGLSLISSSSNIISLSSFNSNNGGILFNASSFNRLTNINVIENLNYGINFVNTSNSNIVHNLLAINNDKVGLISQGSDRNFLSQISIFTTTNSTGTEGALVFSSSNYNKISGNYYEGFNSISCNRNGLTDSSGISASCNSSGLSDFNSISLPSTMPDINSFVSQSFSSFSYSLYSFLSFFSETISFKRNDTSFSPSARGNCFSGDCLIFDYSLSLNDNLFRNLSNQGSIQNSAATVTEGSVCPVEVSGSNFLSYAGCYIGGVWNYSYKSSSCVSNGGTWSSLDTNSGTFSSPKVFLKNAVEIINPNSKNYGTGNHDGLCESGESCIYTPNFGVYQGEGSVGSCVFDPQGGLTGISIFGFLQNGR